MNHHDDKEALLMKQLIRRYLEQHLESLKGDKKDKDNSFIFMENDTLNLFMLFMLRQLDNHPEREHKTMGGAVADTKELSAELDAMIEENELAFKEIINILKEKVD